MTDDMTANSWEEHHHAAREDVKDARDACARLEIELAEARDEPAVEDIFIETFQKIARSLGTISVGTFDNDNSITQGLFAISDSINKLSKSIDDLRRTQHGV